MPLYILILAGFGAMTGGVLFFRHVWFSDMPVAVKIFCALIAVAIALLPLLMMRGTPARLTRFDRWVRHFLYAVYVCAVLWMILTLMADMVCLSGFFAGVWSGAFCLTAGTYTLLLLLGAVLITTIAVFGGLRIPTIKRVVIQLSAIHQPVTIAVLSDMHLHRTVSVKRVRQIVARTNATNPDVIVLTGDIIDDNPRVIGDLIAPLADLKAPRFFVTGNHEFYIGYTAAVQSLAQTGARLLENDGVAIKGIFLAGIPDKTAGVFFGVQADVTRAFRAAKIGAFRVLLSHTPLEAGTKPAFDLEIAGHTHGGQVWPFHILARLGNPYLAGLYRTGKAWIYVSRGAGQWGPQMRFLAPSEITLIELRPAL